MHVAQIKVGRTYRSKQGFEYLVTQLTGVRVFYEMLSGYRVGAKCETDLQDFAERMTTFHKKSMGLTGRAQSPG